MKVQTTSDKPTTQRAVFERRGGLSEDMGSEFVVTATYPDRLGPIGPAVKLSIAQRVCPMTPPAMIASSNGDDGFTFAMVVSNDYEHADALADALEASAAMIRKALGGAR